MLVQSYIFRDNLACQQYNEIKQLTMSKILNIYRFKTLIQGIVEPDNPCILDLAEKCPFFEKRSRALNN